MHRPRSTARSGKYTAARKLGLAGNGNGWRGIVAYHRNKLSRNETKPRSPDHLTFRRHSWPFRPIGHRRPMPVTSPTRVGHHVMWVRTDIPISMTRRDKIGPGGGACHHIAPAARRSGRVGRRHDLPSSESVPHPLRPLIERELIALHRQCLSFPTKTGFSAGRSDFKRMA